MESLHEAILSEPGYYEANSDFESPQEGIESGSGVDEMESTSPNSIEISQSNENDRRDFPDFLKKKIHIEIIHLTFVELKESYHFCVTGGVEVGSRLQLEN